MANTVVKTEALSEQSTSSTTPSDFVSVTLPTNSTGLSVPWVIFASGEIRLSNTGSSHFAVPSLVSDVNGTLDTQFWQSRDATNWFPYQAICPYDQGAGDAGTLSLQLATLSGGFTIYARNLRIYALQLTANDWGQATGGGSTNSASYTQLEDDLFWNANGESDYLVLAGC